MTRDESHLADIFPDREQIVLAIAEEDAYFRELCRELESTVERVRSLESCPPESVAVEIDLLLRRRDRLVEEISKKVLESDLTEPRPRQRDRSMNEIILRLREEHANFAKMLSFLDREIGKYASAGQPDYDLIARILDYTASYSDDYHHPKEDVVCARLRERDPQFADAVEDLLEEHAKLASLTKAFAKALDHVLLDLDQPRSELVDAASEFASYFRDHIGLEETKIFPRAEQVLTQSDWDELADSLEHRDDPLFGPNVGVTYKRLREEILAYAAE